MRVVNLALVEYHNLSIPSGHRQPARRKGYARYALDAIRRLRSQGLRPTTRAVIKAVEATYGTLTVDDKKRPYDEKRRRVYDKKQRVCALRRLERMGLIHEHTDGSWQTGEVEGVQQVMTLHLRFSIGRGAHLSVRLYT